MVWAEALSTSLDQDNQAGTGTRGTKWYRVGNIYTTQVVNPILEVSMQLKTHVLYISSTLSGAVCAVCVLCAGDRPDGQDRNGL